MNYQSHLNLLKKQIYFIIVKFINKDFISNKHNLKTQIEECLKNRLNIMFEERVIDKWKFEFVFFEIDRIQIIIHIEDIFYNKLSHQFYYDLQQIKN